MAVFPLISFEPPFCWAAETRTRLLYKIARQVFVAGTTLLSLSTGQAGSAQH